ncbi:MAG: methylenetetrahydrofolate reductase [Deltaproteobacteria bacterium]|nr:methylenetetrahydrofolate reductase [Deltaproteobacteria bacterium]
MLPHSIELIPRSEASLEADLLRIRESLPGFDTVNIPDLSRFALRSWDACRMARGHVSRAIPHLRAMDFDLMGAQRAPLSLDLLKQRILEAGLEEVIVVQGDTPDGCAPRGVTTSVQLIRALRETLPDLTIFAALDPYRASPARECAYAREKREAGADGFFTQPFFDLRYQDVWADLLAGERVYWGVSPLMAASTRRYWERRNLAFLPRDFEPTLAWNRCYAKRAIAWAAECQASLYFMPIRVDLVEILGGLTEGS